MFQEEREREEGRKNGEGYRDREEKREETPPDVGIITKVNRINRTEKNTKHAFMFCISKNALLIRRLSLERSTAEFPTILQVTRLLYRSHSPSARALIFPKKLIEIQI